VSDRREVPARSDGERLYLKMDPAGLDVTYDWMGPAGAHHATIDEHERTFHPYGSELRLEISVYDAEGMLLGTLTTTEWS
jgi:hypothetical protein